MITRCLHNYLLSIIITCVFKICEVNAENYITGSSIFCYLLKQCGDLNLENANSKSLLNCFYICKNLPLYLVCLVYIIYFVLITRVCNNSNIKRFNGQNVNANRKRSPCRNLAGSQDKIVTCVYNSGTRDQRGLNIPPCEPLLPPYFTFLYPVTE